MLALAFLLLGFYMGLITLNKRIKAKPEKENMYAKIAMFLFIVSVCCFAIALLLAIKSGLTAPITLGLLSVAVGVTSLGKMQLDLLNDARASSSALADN